MGRWLLFNYRMELAGLSFATDDITEGHVLLRADKEAMEVEEFGWEGSD